MAVFDTTNQAPFLADVWAKNAMLAREEALIMGKRVLRFDVEVKKKGDVLTIPQVTNLTTNAVGSGGTYVGQSPAESNYTININRWREAAVEIPDLITVQSSYDLMSLYSKKIGYALALDLEDQLFNLYSGLANSVGTSGIALTDDTLLNAIQILDEGVAPLEDRTMTFRPASKRTLMKIDKFVDSSKTGLGRGSQITGLFGEIYGIPVYFSNRVVSSSGIRNMVFHKEAFGAAVQIDIKMEKFRLSLADDLVGHILFGTSELRDTAGMGISACEVLT
ncbi:MAG: hypothetical protein QME66_05775 [Candidatus Eisenbacteria bacterium]|nr:hypothetical protein [Candidatus Eisenbacteria bacterium]